MSHRRKISTAALVMALATFISRIAGLVRDVVVARIFGAGFVSDAFFMAFTIPNLLRRFFGEGALTAAFVPVYTEISAQQGEEESRLLACRCVTLLSMVMLIVVAAGMLLAPWVVKGIGFGFSDISGKLELTTRLTQIMFPYVGLVSLLALLTGILNVRGHFFLPSLSPLLLNAGMIFGALWLGSYFTHPIYGLATGVLLGGGAQLLLQYPVLLRYRVRLRPDFHFRGDPALRQIFRLMLPGIAGVAIYQINVVVTRLLASFLPQGSVSYLYYAQRLFEFPQGIFIVSLAQAVLPMMSRHVADGDEHAFKDSLQFALSLMVVFTLPALLGLIICARPIYSLFFMGGEFGTTALDATSLTLMYYAPGLLFVGLSRVAAQTFYALKDTRTPVLVSFWTLLVNVSLGLMLMGPMQYLGLALSLTLASAFNAFLLIFLLRRRVGPFLREAMIRPLRGVLPATIGMGLVAYVVVNLCDWTQPGAVWLKSFLLLGSITAGVSVFLLICALLKVDEIARGWQLLRGSRGKGHNA
ncbi:murein biosynthesis integral membrane protein MurJ [Geopsychrobacter electrodiphilus]|uniref:murein biosynthesis integral membrane protein MurJ n=1 Tax=Geopsychrobacter electrodiphilus TaxID=225196 RepID=UPI000476590E|nr:murein biosynthesis integral membrane protein MurJ [Geopsychrobacter electrodiphilus]